MCRARNGEIVPFPIGSRMSWHRGELAGSYPSGYVSGGQAASLASRRRQDRLPPRLGRSRRQAPDVSQRKRGPGCPVCRSALVVLLASRATRGAGSWRLNATTSAFPPPVPHQHITLRTPAAGRSVRRVVRLRCFPAAPCARPHRWKRYGIGLSRRGLQRCCCRRASATGESPVR